VAVLEGRRDAEVPLQAAPDGVAGQGAQQLAALGLGGWRGEVVGELTLAALELVGQADDELVGVREGVADVRKSRYRSRTMPSAGFEQQMRMFPSAGGSIGSGA
jgi:hypothetical protein